MTRLPRRRALLIGTQHYQDPAFSDLPAVRADLTAMDQVLSHREIGGFPDVLSVVDLTAEQIRDTLATFLSDSSDDELCLVYFSGHGLRTPDTGEFHFIATDTDPHNPHTTAVCADFVNDLLDYRCRAPQRVVIIDSCFSGGYVLGFRTSDPVPAAAAPGAPGTGTPAGAKSVSSEPGDRRSALSSNGAYVVSSSRSLEKSFQGATSSDPSVFTGVLVDALRTGEAGGGRQHEVSVSDVFDYVNRKLRRDGSSQIPVISSSVVDDRIILAGCPRKPIVPTAGRPPTPGNELPGGQGKSGTPRWPQLIDYYIRCLRNESDSWLPAADIGKAFVCLRGKERLLVGDLDSDHGVPVPPETRQFVDATADHPAQLWAGYPVVATDRPAGGRRAKPEWRIAPLLIRRIEVVDDVRGRRLVPTGPPIAHPALLRECMSEEDAAIFAADYRPTWHSGGRAAMTTDIRNLLRNDFAVDEVQELDPESLAGHLDIHTPTSGARNTAILFRMSGDDGPNRKLLKDLSDIAGKVAEIPRTALSRLLPSDAPDPHGAPPSAGEIRLVAPRECNEMQAEVIRSSMTRQLTVATGPPGTGKSQLVVNLVATAIAADQTVLVASTNNRAVDEVVQRCRELVPGSIVRTGNLGYQPEEQRELRYLAALAPGQNPGTAGAEMDSAAAGLHAHRTHLARAAQRESRLLEAAGRRDSIATDLAGRLGVDTAGLFKILDVADPQRLRRRAQLAYYTPVFSTSRCERLLRDLGLPSSDAPRAGCAVLVRLTAAEIAWRSAWHASAAAADDDQLIQAGQAAETAVRRASVALFDSVVRAKAASGRSFLGALLNHSNGTDWPARADVLRAAPGWAVTAQSVRNFPPRPALFDLVVIDEASQCSTLAIVPLLFRARRALVIGDPMQLTHIATLDGSSHTDVQRRAGIEPQWLERHKLDYRRHSAFHAAHTAAGNSTVLDEHYRCHPRIAATANALFYNGQLRILTEPGDATREEPIVWRDVPGRAAQQRWGSWINTAEVAAVQTVVSDLVDRGIDSIGVITPYRDQAAALSRALSMFDVDIGTVHKFQGGERDVIIFSLVASEGMPAGSISWLDRQPNLWNVAITRARRQLYVVGDGRVWSTRHLGAELIRAAGPEPAAIAAPDDLRSRLRARSTDPSIDRLEIDVAVNAYRADAVAYHHNGDVSVYLLDRGCPDDAPGRHLRLMLRRAELLGNRDRAVEAYRVPAWRMYV
ncbi:caspase, EACC1-associated type [Nocardia rhamnosiphila]|uniref:AAA domain-containing protein n=1 Tax=Nocardia rhamnosiphila TaxID=426716 RepID=A0ABV2WWH5_9NOCA